MKLLNKFSPFWISGIAVFLAIFTLNNYVERDRISIRSDGEGYYDFLPSIFIYHDLDRKDASYAEGDPIFDRFGDNYIYVRYKDAILDKYPIGTAILQFPFFYTTYLMMEGGESTLTGYEREFHKAIQIASFFYLFLGLWLMGRFFRSYGLNTLSLLILIPMIPLGTNVMHYINTDAAFSHVYSMFAIAGFCHNSRKLFLKNNLKSLLLAASFFGLVVILRQINLIVILALPLLADSKEQLLSTIKYTFSKPKNILALLLPPILFVIPQMAVWYFQTGDPIVYSYQGESFYFLKPAFFKILFSYKKGLFVYTPILFLSIVGIIYFMIRKKNVHLAISWLAFFIFLTYVLSSWHAWWYGASFGQRPYIDFFAILFLPLAILIHQLKPSGIRILLVALCFLCIPVNVIQAFQYKNYILHWIDMDKDKYWNVFLKTEDRYRGLVWKEYSEEISLDLFREWKIPSIEVIENGGLTTLLEEEINYVPKSSEISLIEISFDHEFEESNAAFFELTLQSTTKNELVYNDYKPLLHYATQKLNGFQRGVYQYKISLPEDLSETLILRLKSGPMGANLTFSNVEIKAFGRVVNPEVLEAMLKQIKGNPEWYGNIQEEAKRTNQPLDKVLIDHAIYAIENYDQN